MAFLLRRPFTITATLRQLPQSSKPALRQFHHATFKQSFAARPQPFVELSKSKDVFRATFRRAYSNYGSGTATASNSGELRQRLMYGAAIFGGTIVAINLVFNRETRDDGGMPPYESSYLNDTFLHTGLGLGTIAIAARAMHSAGWSVRLMMSNPWLVMGVGLVGSIGTMIATRATHPDK